MNPPDWLALWQREEQVPFVGWDFSYLAGRMIEAPTPWSYPDRAASLLRQSTAVLDLDTGGGEQLLSLRAAWPAQVAATEGYPPNFQLAQEQLTPHGVKVVAANASDGERLPFADGEFDLVLNRHGALNPTETARVLRPSGVFFTQQVHGLYAAGLKAVFGATPRWPEATPEQNLPRLQAAGLAIVRADNWSGELSFADVAAVVYYLKAVPWMVPNFSVTTHQAALFQLQHQLDRGERLIFTARKYLIEAVKA